VNLAIAVSVVCIIGASSACAGQWQNALKPKGDPGTQVTLARAGKALYSILIPAAPSPVEQKAAADLAQWLGEMTGARFPVVRENDAPPKGTVISVGNTHLLAESGSLITRADLGDEGIGIDEIDGNVYLRGGATRGIINAVYALLEEDLGCRWYSRFTQTIPNTPTLTFRAATRVYLPQLEIRDPFYWEAFDGTWSLRNRTNSPSAPVAAEWGGHKAYGLFVHTFSTLVPPDKYFKDHPEYFSEHNGQRDPGQLCVTNPDVVKIAADTAKFILRANPNAQIISVSQNDSVPCCDCPKCKAMAQAEGSQSGPLLAFVNAVADEVGKDYPKVKVSTLAYLDTFMPPKTVKPRPNVAIQLCTDSHAWSQPFLTIEETEKFQTAMKGWAAVGANIDIWDYTVNFSHYASPMPNWQVVTDSIRFFAAHNAKGVMLQGNYQTPGTGDGYMRTWVWAKLLWDPTLDARALMKDFVFGYYGKAAEPIWDFEELQWDTWETQHHGWLRDPAGGIRYPMTLFSEEFMGKARGCFARAEKLADDPSIRRRVEEAELQILYADIERMAAPGRPADPTAFKAALDKFERIARREKMTHIQEGAPDFEAWVAKMRKVAE
jgi:hypothetical protein